MYGSVGDLSIAVKCTPKPALKKPDETRGIPASRVQEDVGFWKRKIFEVQKPFPVIHAHSKSLWGGGCVYLEFQFSLQQVWAAGQGTKKHRWMYLKMLQ